jgi:amino acid transporter
MFVNTPSFRSLIFEIIFVSIALVIDFKARKRPEFANRLHSLRNLIILFMPTVIFVDVLSYLSVLSYLIIFVCWLAYHLIKEQKENKFRGWFFVALVSFIIILFVILYSASH